MEQIPFNSNETTQTTIQVASDITPPINKQTSALPLPPTGPKRKRPFKRPHQHDKGQGTSGKRTKPTFDKSQVAKHVVFTSVIHTAYDLETSFRGIVDLCSIFYNILINRDQKIANLITAQHIQYVTLLSIIYRCCLTASNSTTTIMRGLSYLKETVDKLLLPDLICQYIETVGYIKLSSGVTVIPYIRSYPTMKNTLDFLDPVAILAQMGVPDPGTDWGIDDEVILQYKRAISRVLKNAVQLRLVNNIELEAKPEFLGVYDISANGRVLPLAFEQMNATQCTYGAVMKFRSVQTLREWNGIKPPVVHESKAVDSNTFITDLVLHHLRDGA